MLTYSHLVIISLKILTMYWPHFESEKVEHMEFRGMTKKEHPGLVPYEDLSESEKAYDKATAEETLKVILKLGYVIQKS